MWEEDQEPVEASWEEYSTLHRDFNRFMTVSEHDHIECVRFYRYECNIPENVVNGIDFVPTNFLSGFFIQTHKGNLYIFN